MCLLICACLESHLLIKLCVDKISTSMSVLTLLITSHKYIMNGTSGTSHWRQHAQIICSDAVAKEVLWSSPNLHLIQYITFGFHFASAGLFLHHFSVQVKMENNRHFWDPRNPTEFSSPLLKRCNSLHCKEELNRTNRLLCFNIQYKLCKDSTSPSKWVLCFACEKNIHWHVFQ